MIDQFTVFAQAVRRHFVEMSQDTLYTVAADRDTIWRTYLNSFPPGTNPMFRQRTEHDCSCCRHFIRDIGAVVSIQNGTLASVWDLNGLPMQYQAVSDALSTYVKSLLIDSVYLTPYVKHGTAVSHELIGDTVHTWNHFAVDVPKLFVTNDYVERRGNARTTHDVLLRGLLELEPDNISTVIDLIQNNSLYRGQEFLEQIQEFQRIQSRFLDIANHKEWDMLAWTFVNNPVARFRNTVIGTLVQDLSDGVDVETAVRSFESKVAPANYKRPTALITKGMIQAATKTIAELGLETALERRHARFSDVSVSSVLFVDNAARARLRGGIEDLLMAEAKPAPFDSTKSQTIHIDEFVSTVLPKTTSLQLYLDNTILGNFVSMTAPVHDDVQQLFRWNNNFAWSYDGNVTDSIKERVKRAGGMVEDVAMRVSLAWYNTDDLDLHVFEPGNVHIYFGEKRSRRDGNGYLDVDMNVRTYVRDPVENIRWKNPPRDGTYYLHVHNYTKRESIDVGFTVEIESNLGLETYTFDRALPNQTEQPVASIIVKNHRVESIIHDRNITKGSASQEKWNLKTLNLVKVNSVVLSPNYWEDNHVGNKHWFFILEDCVNPTPTRGIYNEFLHPRLERHRKVFEVLGDKTKCLPSEDQMSGVGFSSTKKDKVTVVAAGPDSRRSYTITFA
jgi:hypothetical protein